MKKEMGIFALGAIVAIVLLGGTNAFNLRADGIQFTDGSVQTSAAIDTTCDGEPCDGTLFTNVVASAGDNATAFFSTGQIEEPRIDDAIARKAEVAAALGLTTFEFLGTTTQTTDGDAGIVAFARMCQQEFGGGARMCTSKEIMESTNTSVSWGSDRGWIRAVANPVMVADQFCDAFSGICTPANSGLNCDAWRGTSGEVTPVVQGPNVGAEGSFNDLPCHYAPGGIGVACCAPVGS